MRLSEFRARLRGRGWPGPVLAAVAAAMGALPALFLPYLSDDWADLDAVIGAKGLLRTPFGYFRPLAMASYWLDVRAFGLSPFMPHLEQVALIAGVAGLAVILVHRYRGDGRLALATGLLFALHPYHIENTAWIAARPDLLCALCVLGAALAYDRWRSARRGWPLLALALLETGLLAKETAVVLPVFLLVLGLCDSTRRPGRDELIRGHLPMWSLALAHFLVLRSYWVGAPGLHLLGWRPFHWFTNLLYFGTASILPAHTERLEARPLAWGLSCAAIVGCLLLASRVRRGALPPLLWSTPPLFLVLLGPSLISFQSRYFLLPCVVSCFALATLLRLSGRWPRVVTLVILVPCWLYFYAQQWLPWRDAAQVSGRLIADLSQASRLEGVDEIVVANMPHRVRGAPVAADFDAAVRLSGGRPARVRTAAAIDYPRADADTLDGDPEHAVRSTPAYSDVRLHIPPVRFSRYVWPRREPGRSVVVTPWATLFFDGDGRLRVRIPRAPDRVRAAYYWHEGRLMRLF